MMQAITPKDFADLPVPVTWIARTCAAAGGNKSWKPEISGITLIQTI
jgi:hypothetical protein